MRVQSEVVRGRPIAVAGRQLVPVVRRTVGEWRQAVIGTRAVTARGGGLVRLRPLGFVERCGGQERLISIPDRTRQALQGMAAAAIIVPLLLMLAVRLSRR